MTTSNVLFERVALIGVGLIGSSLARVIRQENLADHVAAYSRRPKTRKRLKELEIVDDVTPNIKMAVEDADLVVISVPVAASGSVAEKIGPHLKSGAIITDTGSVKEAVIKAVTPYLPKTVHFVPGHPIAGTENSGPKAGFDALFDKRWCVLTPSEGTALSAVKKIRALWQALGAYVEIMDAKHHDQVLAITSHLPHLIAYTLVNTATELERDLKKDVVRFSAGGFRDFTRIAASDPTMWRDVFLSNRDAVLDTLGRFTEDLTALQRAIRRGDGDLLYDRFSRTRAIRREIIDAKQAGTEPWRKRK